MDYAEALAYLDGRLRLGVKLGNERFAAMLRRLEDPQERLRVVHPSRPRFTPALTTSIAAQQLQGNAATEFLIR